MEEKKRTVKCKCGNFTYYAKTTKSDKNIWECAKCGTISHRQVRKRRSKGSKKTTKEGVSKQEDYVVVEEMSHLDSIKTLKKASKVYAYVTSPKCAYPVEISIEDAIGILEQADEDEFIIDSYHGKKGEYVLEPKYNTIIN